MRNLSILVDGGKRGVIMHCYDCLKKDWCPYIHQFNHDPSVGCTDFQDKDYTTYVSNTLNIEEVKMDKELTPLEVSKQLKDFVLEFVKNGLDRMFINGSFDIIEAALKRLEEHDRLFKKYNIDDNWLEPALYVIKNHFPMNTETQLKKFKALEIIKNKKVNVQALFYSSSCEDYNKHYNHYEDLTQEEYDLLKEVLL